MSVKQVEISGTEVNGVKAPTLEQLTTGACTKAQLQAALVQLINIINLNQEEYRRWADKVEQAVAKKQDKAWRASM